MASVRDSIYAQFITLLAAITGVTATGEGQDWPQLEEYNEAQLPLVWIRHAATGKMDKIPTKYKITERITIRVYFVDLNLIENETTAESWIEKVIEKMESNWNLTGVVDYITLKTYTIRERLFPVSSIEVTYDVDYHTTRTNF